MQKITGLILSILLVIALVGPATADSPEDANAKPASTVSTPLEENSEPQDLKPEPTPEQDTGPVVSYLIEAQLFPGIRKLTGSETLAWRNTSPYPVDHLRFHLYYNAFRNLDTTFMKEAGLYKTYPLAYQQKKLKFGEIKITEIRKIGGEDLTDKIRFISPDDDNPDDRTVMELKPAEPILPGQIYRLKIEFALTIPGIFARTGAEGDYFLMAQWFPKVGVLQDNGQWNCHQFHYNSEFFADYGSYRVWLTIPENFVIGASGVLIKSEANADKTLTYVFEENNIHDFAWTAFPHFTRVTDSFQAEGSRVATGIELLLAPGHGAAKDRYLNVLKFTLDFYARHIFPYPYKKITVVDPPLKGIMSSGMEYPTLITAGYIDLLGNSLKLTEALTIHEFNHQYWYGIVGSDESSEAWLDEGVASFFELEIMDEYAKDHGSMVDSFLIKIAAWEFRRLFYTLAQPLEPVNSYSWKFLNRSQYAAAVYSKTAILLRSLKNLVGKEQMYNFFKYYAEKYKFRHPSSEDFIDAFNTFMNEDFSWAFDQFIRTEKGLDHAVYSVGAVKISAKPDMYRNEAVFIRKEGYFPVELLITLESGKEFRSFWKKNEKWKKIVIDDPSPMQFAAIDPLYKIPLDRDFLNNSKVCKPSHSAIKRLSLRIGFFFQNLLGCIIL